MGRSLKYKRTDARLSSSFTSEDLQGGGVFSVVVWPYDDLHVLIEGDEEAQEVPHGELAEVAAQLLEASEEIKIPRDRCAWNLTLRQAQGRLSRKERETWGALCMS